MDFAAAPWISAGPATLTWATQPRVFGSLWLAPLETLGVDHCWEAYITEKDLLICSDFLYFLVLAATPFDIYIYIQRKEKRMKKVLIFK